MTTNTTAAELKYYRIKLSSEPYDRFEYGRTALEAIQTVKDELLGEGFMFLGSASARPAVYGEWDCAPHHFHNDGTHSHDYGTN